MTDQQIGIYPGGTNPAFIHLTGTIISWWARTEGIMMQDILCLRSQPFSAALIKGKKFPNGTRSTIRHWKNLLLNAYALDSDQRGQIETASTTAIDLLEHRDRLVHSFWPYGQTDQHTLQLNWIRPDESQEHGFRSGKYCMTVSELNLVNQKFANLYHAVMAISVNSARLYS